MSVQKWWFIRDKIDALDIFNVTATQFLYNAMNSSSSASVILSEICEAGGNFSEPLKSAAKS